MSQMINVDGSDDPSYRYKMPRLVSKVEGRGNGVKTVLVNCTEVAASLHRSSAQVTKYFGCELGAMTKYEKDIPRSLVNGAFDNGILQDALTGFIQKFVLCPSCGNPETVQELKGKKKSALVFLNCKACGACEEADNSHKLLTFLVKEISGGGEDGKSSKKELRKLKKKMKKEAGEKSSVTGENGELNEEELKEKKAKKKKKKKEKEAKKKEKKKLKQLKKLQEQKAMQDEASSSDSDAEDAKPPKETPLEEDFSNLTVHDVAAISSAADRVTEKLQTTASDDDLCTLVSDLQVNSGLQKQDQVAILFYGLFNASISLDNLMKRFPLLQKVVNIVHKSFKTPTDVEVELLLCMEEAVQRAEEGADREKLTKMVPVVVKLLYDDDLVQESLIIDWFSGTIAGGKFKHVRSIVEPEVVHEVKAAAKQIIDWLNEADTDSSSDEE